MFASLAEQTFSLKETEILFVDDASSDNSEATAHALAATLDCEQFTFIQAGGKRHPAAVRNKGFAKAKGTFLFYIDADDALTPDFLQACISILQARPEIDLVYTGQHLISPLASSPPSAEKREIILPEATPALLTWQNVISSPPVFRRQVWEQSNGFRSNTKYEDWDFWLQATANKFQFYRVEHPLFNYFSHAESFSEQAESEDAMSKAQLVINTPSLFHPLVTTWAKSLLKNEKETALFPRGVIPLPKDLLD